MASQQPRRENKTDEPEKKENVPKTTHYESLTVVDSGEQPGSAAVVHHVIDTVQVGAGGKHDQSQGATLHSTQSQKNKSSAVSRKDVEQNKGANLQSRGKDANEQKGNTTTTQYKGPSLEEISKSRGTAQQHSMEAIRAATKNQSGATQTNLEKVGQRTGDQGKKNNSGATQSAAERVGQVSAGQAKDKSSGATHSVAEKVGQQTGDQTKKNLSGSTQTAMKKGEQNKNNASGLTQRVAVPEKSQLGKKKISAVGQTAMEKDYPSEKHGEDKDIISKKSTRFTDAAVDIGKKGADYIGSGKDITMETGKAAAEYGGKMAAVVEDIGLVAGWNAAEFATNKVGDAAKNIEDITNTAVDVGGKGVSYVGGKVMEGKDVAVETGKTAAQYVGKAAGALEGSTVVVARNATEVASDQVDGVRGNIQNVSETVVGMTDTVVDVAKKGASYFGGKVIEGKDVALEMGKTTTEYAGKAAGVLGDVGIVAGWKTTKFASDKVGGLKENIENIPDTIADVSKTGAGYLGEKVVTGRDTIFETGKTATKYVGEVAGVLEDVGVVGGWNTAKFAGDKVGGLQENVENVANTVVDVSKKGGSYIGENVVAGKDVALKTGKATGEYVGKVADAVGDISVVAGWEAVKYAGDKGVGLRENIENATNTMADVSKQGASYIGGKVVEGKDVALKTGKATTQYAGEMAGVLEDVGVVSGWEAAKFASEKGVNLKENIENIPDTLVDVSKRGASYIGGKAIAGKDITMETGKATAQYAGEMAGVLEDIGVVAGWEGARFVGGKGIGLKETIESVITTMENVSKQGASYIGEKAIEGKDIILETGKTTAQYVGKMAGVLEDIGVVAGWEAARFVGDKGVGLKENMENATKTMADVSKQGASYIGEKVAEGKDITSEKGKTTAQYASEMAGVLEDVGVVTGWEAAKFASDKGVGLKENIENVIDTMVDVSEKGVSYIGEKVGAGKDITLEAGKTAANIAGEVAGVVSDVSVMTGRNTAEFAGDIVGGMALNIKNVTMGVARANEDTTMATKDVQADVRTKTKGMVSEREESAKDYALRMNVEKEREQEANNSSPLKVEGELGGYVMKTQPIDVELEIKNQASGGGGSVGVVKVTRETVEIVKNKTDKKLGRGG